MLVVSSFKPLQRSLAGTLSRLNPTRAQRQVSFIAFLERDLGWRETGREVCLVQLYITSKRWYRTLIK